MSSPLTVIYEFDRFRLDRGNQRLTRDGLLVSMPGKTLPLLLELVENRKHVVSTDKLVNAFFPTSPFGEEELTSEILTLKRLLDDTSKQAPMVRFTVGKGYQFEAEVTESLADSGSDRPFGRRSSEAEPVQAQAREVSPPKKTARIVGMAVAVVLIAGIGFGIWRFLPARSAASNGTPQLAVLPFQSLTGAAGDDSFNRSLTEAIITALGKQSQLQVVPQASVQRYLDSGASDPVTAGRELGAQMIVRGMAQRLAGRILVKVQLVSTEDGTQIWSNGFEGDSNDVAGLSARISEKIGKGIPAPETVEQP
jgi:TolB-like protein/DNA-binding winged helix-turn-helix (wHTH) protein